MDNEIEQIQKSLLLHSHAWNRCSGGLLLGLVLLLAVTWYLFTMGAIRWPLEEIGSHVSGTAYSRDVFRYLFWLWVCLAAAVAFGEARES